MPVNNKEKTSPQGRVLHIQNDSVVSPFAVFNNQMLG